MSKRQDMIASTCQAAADALKAGGKRDDVLDTYGKILAKAIKLAKDKCREMIRLRLIIAHKSTAAPVMSKPDQPEENRA